MKIMKIGSLKTMLALGIVSVIGLSSCFLSNSGDGASLARVKIDTVLTNIDTLTIESVRIDSISPNNAGDSLSGWYMFIERKLIDSLYTRTLTTSQDGIDSMESISFHVIDTLKIAGSQIPVSAKAESHLDTVVQKTTLADTTLFFDADTGLVLNLTYYADTIISKTYSSSLESFGKTLNLRYLSQTKISSESFGLDTVRFYSLDSIVGPKTDTLHSEVSLKETRFRTGANDFVVRELQKIQTERQFYLYHFHWISSKWVQDSLNNWVQVSDTTKGKYLKPIGVTSDTLYSTDTTYFKSSYVMGVLSDYKTGSYSVATLDGKVIRNKIGPIHSDATVRFFGGNEVYIINRYGRDNVQILDRQSWKTIGQFTLPALSNPHDLILAEGKLYAVYLGYNQVTIHNPTSGKLLDSISLAAFADSGDGIAEAIQVIWDASQKKLLVLLGRLDVNNNWSPTISLLLQIDPVSRVIKSLKLPFKNANTMELEKSGSLLVTANGNYGDLDGGLIRINPKSMTILDTLLTEKALGADMDGSLLVDTTLILKKTSFTEAQIVRFNLNTKTINPLASSEAFSLSAMVYDSVGKTLYVGDRIKGLRFFSVPSFTEKSGSGLNMGLPISSLVVVR